MSMNDQINNKNIDYYTFKYYKYLAKYQKLAEEINGGAKKASKSPKSKSPKSQKSKPSKSPKSPQSKSPKSPKSPQSNSPKKTVNRKTPEKKDSEKKDSEKKDSEKNKFEKKDSENKDSEKKDSEKEHNNSTESSPSYTQILKTETPDNKQNQLNLNSSNTETKNDAIILQPKKIDDNYFNLTDSSSSYSNIFYKTY